MGDHVATSPSQAVHPWKATVRTVVQVGVVLFTFVPAAGPAILNILTEDLRAHLSAGITAWLLTAAAVLTALAGAVARIMAIPRVNELLGRIRLDAGTPSRMTRELLGMRLAVLAEDVLSDITAALTTVLQSTSPHNITNHVATLGSSYENYVRIR